MNQMKCEVIMLNHSRLAQVSLLMMINERKKAHTTPVWALVSGVETLFIRMHVYLVRLLIRDAFGRDC